MKPLTYAAATIAALLTVLGTRVLVPALQVMYYSALKEWEPAEPEPVLTTVVVSEQSEQRQAVSANKLNEDTAPATKPAATAKPRTTRKRVARKAPAAVTA